MTPGAKRERLRTIWECLRHSPGGSNLGNGCRRALIDRHLDHPERSATIITTIALVGEKDRWFSIWEEGGGLTAVIWTASSPTNSESRGEIKELQRRLEAAQVRTQVRWARPNEWLARKGWSNIYEGC